MAEILVWENQCMVCAERRRQELKGSSSQWPGESPTDLIEHGKLHEMILSRWNATHKHGK